MAPEMPVGKRIQQYRIRRGLTQEVLAGRVGLSTSWLSQVERGIRGVDKWQTIIDLAEVLRCDPRDLVGSHLNLAPNGGLPFKALPDLRAVLTGYDSFLAAVDTEKAAEAGATRDVDEVPGFQRRVDEANRLYQAGRYEEAARGLVQLVGDVEHARWELPRDQRDMVFGVLAETYQAIAKTLTKVHETELSWVAAERAASAAERSEDMRLVAATAYHLGHCLRRAGRVREALSVSERAYGAVIRHMRDGQDSGLLGLAGGLTLTSVIAAASADDRPAVRELINRAAHLADRLGRDGNDYWFAFGPTNVRIHQIWIGVELGEPREAIRVGESIEAAALPSGLVGRRTAIMIDMARAYGQVRMDAAAMNMLLDAERLSAQTVRYSHFVRELLRELLRREHRATTPQLRPLAERIGLLD